MVCLDFRHFSLMAYLKFLICSYISNEESSANRSYGANRRLVSFNFYCYEKRNKEKKKRLYN